MDSSILKKNNILEENLSAVGMSPLEKKSINLPAVCSILGDRYLLNTFSTGAVAET